MSRELEQQLECLLSTPRANEDAERRALGLALAALPEAAGGRSRLRVIVPAAAAILVLLAVAAAALATAGALHVSLGPRSSTPPAVKPLLQVPAGATAVAAVVDRKLWLTTRSGLRIEGLPVHSATLSPHALYVAAGIGHSLVAMAPDGARAWSRPAGGDVVAIAWAPDGLRIAYVVDRRGRFQLRTIEGNGIDDRLLDGSVRPVTPTWRADSLAVAYVGAGGMPVVYDFAHDSHRAGASTRDVRQIAFAPHGDTLAIASGSRVWLETPGRTLQVSGIGRCGGCDIAWANGRLIVATSPHTSTGSVLQLFSVAPNGHASTTGPLALSERLEGLDASGNAIVLAVAWPGTATRLLASAFGSAPEVVLELPARTKIDAVSVR